MDLSFKRSIITAFLIFLLVFVYCCPMLYAADRPLPDTGQTKFYDNSGEISEPGPGDDFYGQDANYRRVRSYTKLDENGVDLPFSATEWSQVRDNVTGLIWEVKHHKDNVRNYTDPNDADNKYCWYDSNQTTNGGNAGVPGNGSSTYDTETHFINQLNGMNSGSGYCGKNDWRLPTVTELSRLVNAGLNYPAINSDYFKNVLSSAGYWSSTTYAYNTNFAWLVYFNNGSVGSNHKSYSYYVRAVRSGQTGSLAPLIINQNDPNIEVDDTVTDPNTGLMWQRFANGNMSWQDALNHCEGMTLAGYDDWHLPDRNELQSLIDYKRYAPALDGDYFPNIEWASNWWWSSTTIVDGPNYALCFEFDNGGVASLEKSIGGGAIVRAVRSVCVPPPPDMVAWWSGDGHPNDIKGNNHGTIVGNGVGYTTSADGKVDQAFNFGTTEGERGYVSVPDAPSLRATDELSLDMWVNFDDVGLPGHSMVLLEKDSDYYLGWRQDQYYPSGVLTMGLMVENAASAGPPSYGYWISCLADVGAQLFDGGGGWHHIAVTAKNPAGPTESCEGSVPDHEFHFYIDGVAVAPDKLQLSLNSCSVIANGWNTDDHTGDLHIGSRSLALQDATAPSDPFYGKIDEVEIFNRQLTSQEVIAIYNAGSAGKCKEPPCDNDFDFSGNFVHDNDVVKIKFRVCAENSTVTFFTSSFDDDGFDPEVTIWDSAGNFIDFNDDGDCPWNDVCTASSNGVDYDYGCYDSYLEISALPPGEYFATITQYDNDPAYFYDDDPIRLCDGFFYDDDPYFTCYCGEYGEDCEGNGCFDDLNSNWEFHILNIATAQIVNSSDDLTCSHSLTPLNASFPAVNDGPLAGEFSVNCYPCDCFWTAILAPDCDWVTITSGTGTGTGTVEYTLAANPSTHVRTTTITVGEAVHTITQAGAECSFTMDPAQADYPFIGGGGTVDLGVEPYDCENNAWDPVVADPWVNITGIACSGGGGTPPPGIRGPALERHCIISYTVAPNPGSLGRTTTITVGAAIHTINQAGTTPDKKFIRISGIVTETLRELQWQDEYDNNLITTNDDIAIMDWDAAQNYCQNLTLGGYDDWRLPTLDELLGIVDPDAANPSIYSAFLQTEPDFYWTATTPYSSVAEFVHFFGGNHGLNFKDKSAYVRCVRSGSGLIFDKRLVRRFVRGLYLNILERNADLGGLSFWTKELMQRSGASVALSFFNSSEFLARDLDDGAFVDILYRALMGREPDSGGRDFWLAELAGSTSRESVIFSFLAAPEFATLASSYGIVAINDSDWPDTELEGVTGFVWRFYAEVLGREPDQGGLDYWTNALSNAELSSGDIAARFFTSDEYINRNESDAVFVETCYRAFFDRDSDSGGRTYWLRRLSEGTLRTDVVAAFVDSQEFLNLAASYGIQ